jgi:hypothetical protein
LLLLNRGLTSRLTLLLAQTAFRLCIRWLLLHRSLTSRLTLLLAQTAFRLRIWLLLLDRSLTSRLTLRLRLTKSPFQLLCFRHLTSAGNKLPADRLAPLCRISRNTILGLGGRLGQRDQHHNRSSRLEHHQALH